jgi:hypothetical protein
VRTKHDLTASDKINLPLNTFLGYKILHTCLPFILRFAQDGTLNSRNWFLPA